MPALRVLLNLWRLLTWPVWGWVRWLRRRGVHTVRIRIAGAVAELPPSLPWWRRQLPDPRKTRTVYVWDVRRLVTAIRKDDRVRTVLVELDSLAAGWGTCASLREELASVRSESRKLVLFLPSGAGHRELYVASAADRVVVSPQGGVTTLGLSVQRFYLAPLLQRVGLQVEVFAQGAYKSAAEPLVRDRMGEREREQLSDLLSSIDGDLRQCLASRPRAQASSVDAAFERGLQTTEQAQEDGLVDAAGYEESVLSDGGDDTKRSPMTAPAYWARRLRPFWKPLRPRPTIAIVRLEGTIVQGLAQGPIAARGVSRALRALGRNPRVRGVLLYINSPGGSALASDLIHHEVQRLDAHKPVVAWFGDVAASGGYYIAAAARRIVAQPTCITGSIGVIAARPLATALFDSLGVKSEVVKQSPRADLYSPARELDEADRELIDAETRRVYDRFVEVVCEGRGRPRDEIEPLAGGRVWSARHAHERGLVDVLGGYREARDELLKLLDGAPDAEQFDVAVVDPSAKGGRPGEPLPDPKAWLAELHPQLGVAAQVWSAASSERVLTYAADLPIVD